MGVYDPTDEYDEIDEPSEISRIGEGRRKTLAAIDAKDTLDDPQSFSSIEEMLNAVREISLAHPDGRVYMAPPEDALDAIEAAYSDLPEEAQQEYLNDHRLYVKIRAARNRFNDWMGKKRREQEIPSSMEAGPSKYPSKKAKKTAQYAREGREELDEAIGKITSAARGAKQRALEATGSSLAEHNEEKAQEQAETVKEQLEPGDIVWNRDTVYGRAPWGVKRLNEKSVRLKRPHDRAGQEKPMSDGETYPEYDLTTVDYDSDFLKPTTHEEWEDVDELGEGWDPALGQGYEAAIRYLMGDEWVDENLDLGETTETDMSDSNDTYDPTEEFSDDRPQQDQLTEGSARASADTESRVDEGGSEEFVDDRSDVYDPTQEDAGEQSSLVPKEVEGQADLTGGQATEDPEYQDPEPEETEGRFDAEEQGRLIEHAKKATIGSSLIRTIGADTQMGMANNFAEAGFEEPADLLDEDADFQEIEGVGPATEEKIEDALPHIRAGVEEAGGDDSGGGRDEWADAVEYIRGLYGDGYDDRIELSNDLMDHGREEGLETPQVIGGEGVTQPLIRYQDVPPEDAWAQIQNSAPAQTHDAIRELIISFAADQAAEGADEDVEDEDDATPAQYQPWLSEVKGIGDATEGRIQEELGFLNLWGAKQAWEDRNETDEWDRLVELLPSTQAKENLLDEIDADVDDTGDDVDEGELLPVTARGRRKKAERERFDEIGPFEAEYDNQGLVKYHIPGRKDDGPRMALRFNHQKETWKAQVSEEGWARPKEMQTVGTGTLDEAVEYLEDVAGPLAEDTGADAGDDVGTYDPTKEWDPEEAAEQAKAMKKARERPLPEAEERQYIRDHRFSDDYTGYVYDKRELVGTGLSASDITDWPSHGAEQEDPNEIEHHEEMMEEIYDPTLEAEPDRPYQVDLDGLESVATDALGLLRRDYHQQQAKRGDGFKYDFDRSDVGSLIGRFNAGTIDQGLTEEELDILWAATAYFADQQGNTRDLGQLEDAMAEAQNQAEETDMSTESDNVYDPTEEYSEETGAPIEDRTDDDNRPEHPNVSGDRAAARLVVGNRNFALPQPWDGWHDVSVQQQAINAGGSRGDYVAYISASREEALVFNGTATSNKWSLKAWRYASPLPEYPDGDDLQFGPGGADGDDEAVQLTHGNTATIEGWEANKEHYLTVEEVRERVPNPAGADRGETGPADEGRSAEVSRHHHPPKEVNGWTKADAPTIEYQNPGNTALAHVEAHANDTFTAQVQGDETGMERIGNYETRTDATEALVDWMEETDPEGYGLDDDVDDTDVSEEEPGIRAEEVRLGTIDAANEARHEYEEWLHPSDNRAMKTVRFDPDTPDDVLDDVGSQALISSIEGKQYGQIQLAEAERDELEDRRGWSWGTHGFHAMSSKAVLVEEGATPWLDYYSMDLEPIEHASVAEGGKEMAMKQGLTGPGETGMPDDSDVDMEEVAQAEDKGRGEACDHARDAAEEGYSEAAEFLIEECGWTEEEVEELLETARAMGEEPAEIYDPVADQDTGQSFEEWAREAEPEPPSEPSDDEILEIAPTSTPEELTGPALRALKKAWTGYKMARVDARESYQEAEKYAAVINGIRSVNGQEPLDFNEIEGWEGGDVMPDEPGEEYPAPEGGEETLAEAVRHGHASGAAQTLISSFTDKAKEAANGDVYDPTEEF